MSLPGPKDAPLGGGDDLPPVLLLNRRIAQTPVVRRPLAQLGLREIRWKVTGIHRPGIEEVVVRHVFARSREVVCLVAVVRKHVRTPCLLGLPFPASYRCRASPCNGRRGSVNQRLQPPDALLRWRMA